MPAHPPQFYSSLPKVELHRHLEGSLRLATLLELAKDYQLDLPSSVHLSTLVQVAKADPLTSQNFLSKFEILRKFYRSPEVIIRLTREAIADASADNVRYLELRFTPVALSKARDFPLNEVMDWVIEGAQQAQEENGITTRLIASVNRHESLDLAAQVASLAVERCDSLIVGLDLAGDEAEFSMSPFEPIFQEANRDGLHITVHAGEWGDASNVNQAISQLGADRIGHGVRVMEDSAVVTLARERGTPFEVCPTSNYQSGVAVPLGEHPIKSMVAAGLNVTINTDDPSVSQITLSDEYQLVCEQLGFTQTILRGRVLAAAEASFLPPTEREKLVASIEQDFPILD
jgi:adenosine deaminase